MIKHDPVMNFDDEGAVVAEPYDNFALRMWCVEQAVKATKYCTTVDPQFLEKLTRFFFDFVMHKEKTL
jgi:hypothetical protein